MNIAPLKPLLVCLLLIGTVSCATSCPNPNVANATPINVSSNNSSEDDEDDAPKTRAIGSALASKLKASGSAEDDLALRKRVQELESLVEQQKKLIELYKGKQ